MHKVKKPKKKEAMHAAPSKTVAAQAPSTAPAVKSIVWPKPVSGKRVVLNIVNSNVPLPKSFSPEQWQEIRVSREQPDAHIPTDMRGLAALPSESCDAIWNTGSLSYLYAHEVAPVLKECHRILRHSGVLMMTLTDMQRIGQTLTQGKIERELYRAPAGSITALDLIYGHRASIQKGRTDLQIKTAFTASSIANKLTPCGFGEVEVKRDTSSMMQVLARKVTANPPDKPLVRILEEDLNEMMRKRDNIDKEPEMLKITPEGGI